jgi:hypothetical protein
MNRITVQPGGADRRVAVENLKGTYFEQGVPREVYDTPYIRKCLACGDLVEVPAATARPATPVASAAAATKGE